MTLLDRYFIRQMLLIALFAVLIFTICWLAPEIMMKAIRGIFEHRLTLQQGLAYMLYQIAPVLVYCLPISALFAGIFFFRQISLSAELIVIMASGVAFKRLLIPVAIVGFSISVLFFVTQEYFVPTSQQALTDLQKAAKFDTDKLADPQITFIDKTPEGNMSQFLVIKPTPGDDQNRFIFLLYEGAGDATRIRHIVTASKGVWDEATDGWQLSDGVEYTIDEEGIYRDVARFSAKNVPSSSIAHELLSFPSTNAAEMNLRQLGQYVRLLEHGGQSENAAFYRVRLNQRYVLMWAPLIFAMFGAAIGIERSRARRNLGLTYAALILLFYNVMVPVSTTLGSIGIVSPILAAFLPLILTSLGGFGILKLRQAES